MRAMNVNHNPDNHRLRVIPHMLNYKTAACVNTVQPFSFQYMHIALKIAKNVDK